MRCCTFFLCLWQIALFALQSLNAQKIPLTFGKVSPMFVEARKENIVAVLDTFSGRYAVRTSEDKNILFYRDGGATSFINVKLGNRVYTSNGLPGYNTPEGTRSLGKGKVTYDSSRIVYEWDVNYYEGSWHVTQELTPEVNDEIQEVKIKVEVKNTGSAATSVGIVMVHDIEVNGNDGALPIIDNKEIAYEQNISPIPDSWSAQGYVGVRDKVIGRLRGGGLTPTDRFIAGQYTPNGRLGGASFNYQPDNVRIKDCALLMQWDEEQLQANDIKSIFTAVGFQKTRVATFGKEFLISSEMLPAIGPGTIGSFTIISDTIAHVTITQELRNYVYRDSITITPGIPNVFKIDTITSYNWWTPTDQRKDDKQVHYRKPFKIISDADIYLIASGNRDVTTVLADTLLTTDYIIPGGFGEFSFQIVSPYNNNVMITTAINGGRGNSPQTASIQKGVPFIKILESNEEISIQLVWVARDQMFGKKTWDPMFPFEFGDGSGTEIKSAFPVKLSLFSGAEIVNVPIPRIDTSLHFDYRHSFSLIEEVLPINQWGKEYYCVPFMRPTARKPGDFFKIIASEDNTELIMNGNPFSRTLNKCDYVDTLSNEPLYVSANKPISVYQYATHFTFTQADTIGAKAMTALLATERWCKKYYCVQDIWDDNYLWWLRGLIIWSAPKYEFITVICLTNERDKITIDGIKVNPSDFIIDGKFSYLRINSFKRYRIIESSNPIFVVMYGWQYVSGYAYVPPRR